MTPAVADRWATIALLLLSALAFIHLTALPAFEDEGSQLRWIWRALTPVSLLGVLMVVVAAWQWRRGRAAWFGLEDLLGIGLGHYRTIGSGLGGARPDLLVELATQLSWPVVIVGLIGLAASALRGDWRQRWLLLMGMVPMLSIGLFTAYWYPRYLLLALPPLIVCSVCGWREIGSVPGTAGQAVGGSWPAAGRAGQVAGHAGQVLSVLVLAPCLGLMGYQSAQLILDPVSARWSPLDRVQYIEGGGSGFGYPEAARFILSAIRPPASILALDGHSAYQLGVYLPPAWRARVRPVLYAADGHVLATEQARFDSLPPGTPVWFVIARPLLPRYLISSFGARAGARLQLREIATFDKPGSKVQLAIYEAIRH